MFQTVASLIISVSNNLVQIKLSGMTLDAVDPVVARLIAAQSYRSGNSFNGHSPPFTDSDSRRVVFVYKSQSSQACIEKVGLCELSFTTCP